MCRSMTLFIEIQVCTMYYFSLENCFSLIFFANCTWDMKLKYALWNKMIITKLWKALKTPSFARNGLFEEAKQQAEILSWPLRRIFSYFHGQNRCKFCISVHYSLRTERSINTKVKKLLILASNCTLLGENNWKQKYLVFRVEDFSL